MVIFSRESEIERQDLCIREIGFQGDHIPFLRNFIFPFSSSPWFKEFDILHTQYHPGIFVGNLARKAVGVPHVFTYHGFAPIRIWRNPKQRMKMIDHRVGTFLALRFGIDRIISVSRFLKRELVNFYRFDENRIHVIYNGVDTERFNPDVEGGEIRRRYGLEDTPLVLFLGRLAPYKGVQYLIRAMPLILKERPEVKFLIVGSRRFDMLNLPGMADSLGVGDSVIFTGFVPDILIPKFYACCDIFCYPSLWEGFGLTVAEASATGKPVVAFNRCALPEVVENGKTGLLVNPDPAQVAEAINTLLSDEEMRRRMGRRARDRITRLFSWPKMVRETLNLYQKVL